MSPVAVAVLATDPVTREGTIALVSACPRLALARTGRGEPPDVVLVLAGEVTEGVLAAMERASRRPDGVAVTPVVLVADGIDEEQLPRAAGAGLVSLVGRRHSGFADVVDAVVAAGTGRARWVGPDLPAGRESGPVAFAAREVDVLRLLSDGWDTGEVAAMLNYSERTVKNIIHALLERAGLRNRTHAVAHALRSGAL